MYNHKLEEKNKDAKIDFYGLLFMSFLVTACAGELIIAKISLWASVVMTICSWMFTAIAYKHFNKVNKEYELHHALSEVDG